MLTRPISRRLVTPYFPVISQTIPVYSPPQRYFSTTHKMHEQYKSVSDAIIHDHTELDIYANNVLNAPDDDAATRWQNQFVWELARHSIAEEIVVYPAFEKYLGENGKAMADKDRAEHNTLKVQLKEFQNMKPTDPAFTRTLNDLLKDLRQHVKDEEGHDLPSLEQAIAREESMDMASSFERTKMFVPSRSHPSAPDKPPFETVAGLLAAPFDRLLDLFRKFPKDTTPGAREPTDTGRKVM